MAKLNDLVKKGVLKKLRKIHAEKKAELKNISAKTRLRLTQETHKTLEIEQASSFADIDLSRNIPTLEKQILKLEETIKRVEETSEYGTCKDCGDEIPPKRLKEIPWVDRCTECKSAIEKKEKQKNAYRGFVKGRGLAYV
jgi:DnaK suppressor protein